MIWGKHKQRVAVLTSDFSGFTGAEVVALEAANHFAAQGAEVVLRAERSSDAMRAVLAPGVTLADRRIEITEFDTVWSQHGQFCLNLADPARLAAWKGHFISVHLSGSTGAEAFHHAFAARYATSRVVNCSRAIELLEAGKEVSGTTHNLRNAAPARFHMAPAPPAGQLRRLLLVSNHVPAEVEEALTLLAAQGVAIRHLGAAGTFRLIQPEDLADCDAVLSIGKTVQYALSAARPVYCYDHFGGPGWLDAENFDLAEHRNFSGRCTPRRRSGAEIAKDLQTGFAEAERFAQARWPVLSPRYDFDAFMQRLVTTGGGNHFDRPGCAEDVALMRGMVVHLEPLWRDLYHEVGSAPQLDALQHLTAERQAERLQARVDFLEDELARHRRTPWPAMSAMASYALLWLASRLIGPLSRRHGAKLRRSAIKRGPEAYRRPGANLNA